ncbi:hypothetical protein CDAR_39681 [Caerostris darwini]|uniref:Uncharacterized protein n=1 Tax=Caerostris darwini TaxID=1538125 RepID=A0AAV4U6M0_9ARAC|nr:hypothetical protein CDAR_39681 [Caerostris darwini]
MHLTLRDDYKTDLKLFVNILSPEEAKGNHDRKQPRLHCFRTMERPDTPVCQNDGSKFAWTLSRSRILLTPRTVTLDWVNTLRDIPICALLISVLP